MIPWLCLLALLAVFASGDEIRRQNNLVNVFRLKCDALPYRTYFDMQLATCYVRYNDNCANLNMMFDPSQSAIERSVQNYLNRLGFPSMRNTAGWRTCKFAAEISCKTSNGDTGSIQNGRCVQKFSNDATFNEARSSCAKNGGRLFAPHSHEDVRSALVLTLYDNAQAFWIGRISDQQRIRNIDRTDIDFYRWAGRKDFNAQPFASVLLSKSRLGKNGYNHGYEVPNSISSRNAYLCEFGVVGDYFFRIIEDDFTWTGPSETTTTRGDWRTTTTTRRIRTTTRRTSRRTRRPKPTGSRTRPTRSRTSPARTTTTRRPPDVDIDTEAVIYLQRHGLPLLMATATTNLNIRHYRYTVDPNKFNTFTHATPNSVTCGIVPNPQDTNFLQKCNQLKKLIIWRWAELSVIVNQIMEPGKRPLLGQQQDLIYVAPYKGYCGANFELVEYVSTDTRDGRKLVYYPPTEEAKTDRGYPELSRMKFSRSIGWIWKYPFTYDKDFDFIGRNITEYGAITYRFITSLLQNYQHVYTQDPAEAQELAGKYYVEPPVGLVVPVDYYERNRALQNNCPLLFKTTFYRKNKGSVGNNWFGYSPHYRDEHYVKKNDFYCSPFRGYCGAYLEVYNIRTTPGEKLDDNLITADEAEVSNVMMNNGRYKYKHNAQGRCFIWTPDRYMMEEWENEIRQISFKLPKIQQNYYIRGPNQGYHVYSVDPDHQRDLERRGQTNSQVILGRVIDSRSPHGLRNRCPKLFKIKVYQEVGGKGRTHIGTCPPRVKGNFREQGEYLCAPFAGYCGATVLLWQISHQENFKDITYTTDQDEAIRKGGWPAYSHRICYIWQYVSDGEGPKPPITTPKPRPPITKPPRTTRRPRPTTKRPTTKRPKPKPCPTKPPPKPTNKKVDPVKHIRTHGLPLIMATATTKGRPRHYRYTVHAQKLTSMTHVTPNSISCGFVVRPNDKVMLKRCPNLQKRIIWLDKTYNGLPQNTITAPNQKPSGAAKVQDEFFLSPKKGYCGANFELLEYKMKDIKGFKLWIYYPPTAEGKTKQGYPELKNMKFSRSVGFTWKYAPIYQNLKEVTELITNHSAISYRFITSFGQNYQHVYTHNQAQAQQFSSKYYFEPPTGLVVSEDLYKKNPIIKKNCPHLLKTALHKRDMNPPINWFGYQPLAKTGKYSLKGKFYCAPYRGYCGAYLEVYNVRTTPGQKLEDNLITADERELKNVMNNNKRYQHEHNEFGRCFIWTPDRRIMNYWKTRAATLLPSHPLLQSSLYIKGPNKNFHIHMINTQKQTALWHTGTIREIVAHGRLVDANTPHGKNIFKACPRLMKVALFQEVGGKGRTHIGSRRPLVKGNFKLEGRYFCAPYAGYCGATNLLWQISHHHNNKDITYTINRNEAIQKGRHPAYSYRICYIWNKYK